MTSREDSKERAREVFRLTNELRLDLITGMQAYRLLQRQLASNPAREPVPTGIRRLCLTHIVIALAKWNELYKKYKAVLPQCVSGVAKELSSNIENRGVVNFRNKVVGHVWDNDTKQVLSVDEVKSRLHEVLKGDLGAFMLWINDPTTSNPATVVGIIERVHNQDRNDHGFTDDDVLR
jgi:hypothetical protein